MGGRRVGWTRERTRYQVTDQRVLVTSGWRAPRTWSAYLYQVAPVVRSHPDGRADLWLRPGGLDASRRGLAWLSGESSVFSDGPGASAGAFDPRPQGSPTRLALRTLAEAQLAEEAVLSGQRHLAGSQPAAPAVALDAADADVAALVAAIALGAGERVLWTGRSQRAPWWFGPQDAAISGYGLLFLVFAGLLGAWVATTSPSDLVVFVPFMAFGLYVTLGRVVWRRLRIRRSAYVVTDRRLITVWRLRGKPVPVQAPLGGLLPPQILGQSIVTSLVRPAPRRNRWPDLTWPAATTTPPAFVGLADPRAAADLIGQAQLAVPAVGRFL